MAIVVNGNIVVNTDDNTFEVSPMEIDSRVNNGFPYINGIQLALLDPEGYDLYSILPLNDYPTIEPLELIGFEDFQLMFSIDDDYPYIDRIELYEPLPDQPYPKVIFLSETGLYPYQTTKLHEPVPDEPYPNTLWKSKSDNSENPYLGNVIILDWNVNLYPAPRILHEFAVKDKKEYNNLYQPISDEPLYIINAPEPEYAGSFQNSVILNVNSPESIEIVGKYAFADTELESIKLNPKVKYDKQTTFPDTVNISYY